MRDKQEIDKMNSYLDKYVKMQEMLSMAEKVMEAEKKKKKGWFWDNLISKAKISDLCGRHSDWLPSGSVIASKNLSPDHNFKELIETINYWFS